MELGKGLFGGLWLFTGGLWCFTDGLLSFAGGLWSFAGVLWSFAGSLGSFVLVCGGLRSFPVLVNKKYSQISLIFAF